jgi:hypothetical protein
MNVLGGAMNVLGGGEKLKKGLKGLKVLGKVLGILVVLALLVALVWFYVDLNKNVPLYYHIKNVSSEGYLTSPSPIMLLGDVYATGADPQSWEYDEKNGTLSITGVRTDETGATRNQILHLGTQNNRNVDSVPAVDMWSLQLKANQFPTYERYSAHQWTVKRSSNNNGAFQLVNKGNPSLYAKMSDVDSDLGKVVFRDPAVSPMSDLGGDWLITPADDKTKKLLARRKQFNFWSRL